LPTRYELITGLHEGIIDNQKEFLFSIYRREPEWGLLGVSGLEQLPAVNTTLIRQVKKHGLQLSEICKNVLAVKGWQRMNKPFQRIGSKSNAHAGLDFEIATHRFFEAKGLVLKSGVKIPVGIESITKEMP